MATHSLLLRLMAAVLLGRACHAQDATPTTLAAETTQTGATPTASQTASPAAVTSVTSPEVALPLTTPFGGGGVEEEPGEDTVAPLTGTRCRGYYDVMGQWDPPFSCTAGVFLYCCGTCFYRFCCQFRQQRLDQKACSNYDTPIWANTGRPISTGTEREPDHEHDRTHMIVYIICGVVAIMVLVGIFTKLGLEKSRGGGGGGGAQNDLGNSRTLTELLKQPGGDVSSVDGAVSSSTPIGANGISARMLRSRSEQYHLNNAAYAPFGPTMGLPHPHSNLSMPGLALNKYTSLKAVADTAARGYYKSYPLMDFTHYQAPAAATFQPISLHPPRDKSYLHQSSLPPSHDLHSPLSIAIPATVHLERARLPKTTTHPLLAHSAFKAWDSGRGHVHRQASHSTHAPGRRQTYSSRPQHSIETLPELFPQATPYGAGGAYPPQHGGSHPYPSSRHKSYQTNSKTEVTV